MSCVKPWKKRVSSFATHFKGQFQNWDVNNEMLHATFYKTHAGEDIWAWSFRQAHELDPQVPLFVNDFNILSVDQSKTDVETDSYVSSIRRLMVQGSSCWRGRHSRAPLE